MRIVGGLGTAVARILLAICAGSLSAADPAIKTVRLPPGGLQPQVVQTAGALHVVYFSGDPRQGDVFYIRSADSGRTFSQPIRVNSQPGSAVAAGTIRGPQLALGAAGRIHIIWNGSSVAQPRGPLNPAMASDSPHNGLPLLYSRSADGADFEPQHNLMQTTFGLDGGGSVTADDAGNVYAAWQARAPGAPEGEDGRRVWVAKSDDRGETFHAERAVFGQSSGACGCCGMTVLAVPGGNLAALYRAAHKVEHRDLYLLASNDAGETFRGKILDPWNIAACPMSSMSLIDRGERILAAWETAGQVLFTRLTPGTLDFDEPIAAPGPAGHRKHPRLAADSRGRTLLVWAVVEGWGKGGELGWQIFDDQGAALGGAARVEDLPAWSFGAPFAFEDGGFGVLY